LQIFLTNSVSFKCKKVGQMCESSNFLRLPRDMEDDLLEAVKFLIILSRLSMDLLKSEASLMMLFFFIEQDTIQN
jgi:hypothetical protein